MHIIASVPLFPHDPTFPTFYKFSAMRFVTASFDAATVSAELGEQTPRSEQILFVLGVIGDKALPRAASFKPSPRWIAHAHSGFSHGTLAISNEVFHQRLFSLLDKVNALTTLVPVSPSFDKVSPNDALDIVRRWVEHPDFKNTPCEWRPMEVNDALDVQVYEWRYSRNWNMQEEGSMMRSQGSYNVLCKSSPVLAHTAPLLTIHHFGRYHGEPTRDARSKPAHQRLPRGEDDGSNEVPYLLHPLRSVLLVRSLPTTYQRTVR